MPVTKKGWVADMPVRPHEPEVRAVIAEPCKEVCWIGSSPALHSVFHNPEYKAKGQEKGKDPGCFVWAKDKVVHQELVKSSAVADFPRGLRPCKVCFKAISPAMKANEDAKYEAKQVKKTVRKLRDEILAAKTSQKLNLTLHNALNALEKKETTPVLENEASKVASVTDDGGGSGVEKDSKRGRLEEAGKILAAKRQKHAEQNRIRQANFRARKVARS